MGRATALFAAIIWLCMGILCVFISTLLLSINTISCMVKAPICQTFSDFIVYDILFGRVNIQTIYTLMGLLPFLLLSLGTTMLFCTVQQVRYFQNGEPLGAISFSLGFHAFMLVILLLFNGVLGSAVVHWEKGTTSEPFYALYDQPVREEQWERLRTYPSTAATIHLWSLGGGLVLAVLTAVLVNISPTPPRALCTQYLEQKNQCDRCGLVGSENDQRPRCALCQHYFTLQTVVPDNQLTPNIKSPLDLQIIPHTMPVRAVHVEVRYPLALKLDMRDNLPDGWRAAATTQRGLLSLSGPDYLRDPAVLPIDVTVEQRWWAKRNYLIAIRAVDSTEIYQEATYRVRVKSMPNAFEWMGAGIGKIVRWLSRRRENQTSDANIPSEVQSK